MVWLPSALHGATRRAALLSARVFAILARSSLSSCPLTPAAIFEAAAEASSAHHTRRYKPLALSSDATKTRDSLLCPVLSSVIHWNSYRPLCGCEVASRHWSCYWPTHENFLPPRRLLPWTKATASRPRWCFPHATGSSAARLPLTLLILLRNIVSLACSGMFIIFFFLSVLFPLVHPLPSGLVGPVSLVGARLFCLPDSSDVDPASQVPPA